MDQRVLPSDISQTPISPKPTSVVETFFFIVAMWLKMIEMVFLLPFLLPLSPSSVVSQLPFHNTCHLSPPCLKWLLSIHLLCKPQPIHALAWPSRILAAWLHHTILAMCTLLLLLWTLWTVFWVVPHCYTWILLFPRSGIPFCLYS